MNYFSSCFMNRERVYDTGIRFLKKNSLLDSKKRHDDSPLPNDYYALPISIYYNNAS